MPAAEPDQYLSLLIEDIAFGGKGVGRVEGMVVFVPFTIPGERVTVRITKRKKKFAEAELVSIEEASPDRVEPGCRYFGQCGGCAYQHIGYTRQLQVKGMQVEQTLRRVGGLRDVPMRATVGSPKEYGYRNRIRVHVKEGEVGFYRQDRYELIDVEQCPIAAPGANAELAGLRKAVVGDGDYTLRARSGGEFFTQTNDEVAAALLGEVRKMVAEGCHTLIDAYCGAGFFAKGLADRVQRVIGIEENERAVEKARQNAGAGESYVVGDVGLRLGEVLAGVEPESCCLVLDPPAEGVDARVLEYVLGRPPRELVYISCNPATLARDLAWLGKTYTVRGVTPLDMFPQTAEIEVAVHLSKQS